MDFRPIDSAMTPAGDAGAAALSGAPELSHAAYSDVSGADFSKAQQFFQGASDGGVASQALSGLDISGISTSSPMAGAEALSMMPPTGGAEAGVLAGLAGANEPISPMIQLIMKLPGAMGLVTSFFEFLSNFLFSPTGLLDLLNPTMWAQHAMAAFSSASSHMPTISLSMLPSNAPILSSMTGLGQPMFSSDLLSAKLNLSLGNSSYGSLARGGIDALQSNSVNVGGDLTSQTAVFEGGAAGAVPGQLPGGHLSGPSLTDVGSANHVAGNTRLFSDRIGSGSSFNSMNLAAKSPAPLGTTGATNVGQGVANNSMTHGMNPMSQSASLHQPGSFLNNVRFEGAPQVAQMKSNFIPHAGQEVGYNMTPGASQEVGYAGLGAAPNMDASQVSYGPSGYVGNELGASGGSGAGSNNMIAMDQPVQSFKPTLSGAEGQQFRSAFPSGTQSPLPQSGQAGITGLKAKQLSLDSISGNAPKPAAPSSAGTGNGAVANTHKIADAPQTHNAAESAKAHHASDSVKAHKAPSHHEAPKHVAHKVEHHVGKAKPVSENQPLADSSDANLNVTDGTVSDGTEIASANNAASSAEYTIQKGDNLWNIAKNHLGGGTKWQEIYQLNQNLIGQNPDLIYPGTTLQLPGGAPEIASSGSTTMTNYVVKPGDNLWDISHDMLGKGSDWGEIYKANQDIIGSNPRLIHPGQELSIPSHDPAGGTVASSVDPSATNVDPNSMGTSQGAQPTSGSDMSSPQELSSGNDTVKSMQGSGTEYGAPSEQYSMPQTQAAPAPQQVSSYPEATDYVSMNNSNGFQPTVHSKGLPVIPANSQPIEAGPGSAMAATLHGPGDITGASSVMTAGAGGTATAANAAQTAAAANAGVAGKGAVVAGGVFSNLKTLFGKTK